MPEQKENKDFSTYGSEAFKVDQEKKKRVILNIKEESTTGIELEKARDFQFEGTGNPFLDIFKRINFYMVKHSKIKIQVKATFFHLLSVMINSGIPMVKALQSLSRQMNKDPRMKMIIDELEGRIVAGSSLSEALFAFPDVFFEQEVGMIQAGEVSGQLSKTLEVLAHDTEKSSTIRKKVKSALMYPIVIFTLLVAVIAVMLMFVIPQLTDLFSSTSTELPLITRIVVGMSDILINGKLQIAAVIGGLILTFIIAKKTESGRYYIDKIKINIPIFGALLKKSHLSRFARSLSNLLDSSVTIIRTMQITADSVGNEVYRKRLMLSVEDIKQGIPLAESITASDLFPPMLVSMIEVGESTAQLDTIMAKVADFYEDEVDTTVAGLSKIIEPIMLIIIGITVGAVVAAIMLPIMELSNLAGSI